MTDSPAPTRPRRILVVRWGVPRPDTNSADRRLVNLLRLMCRCHHVVLCCPTSEPAEDLLVSQRYADQLRELGVRVPTLKTAEFDRFWFHRNISKRSYDVIFFEYWKAAWGHLAIARACQPWAKLIVDSVDVHFLRETAEMDFRPLGPDQRATVSRNQQQELETYRGADAVVVVTAEDQEALAAYPGMPKPYRLPNIVPIRDRSPGPRRPEILFVGGFNHTPNIDGIVWFVQEAWPTVKAAVPEAELTIVGNRPTPEVQALGQVAGVTVVGYVPETDPYLDRAAVVIAPLRYGAGMKGKVTEALACGAAVVTTTIGNQGFGAVSNEHLLVGDVRRNSPLKWSPCCATRRVLSGWAKRAATSWRGICAGGGGPRLGASGGGGRESGPANAWPASPLVVRCRRLRRPASSPSAASLAADQKSVEKPPAVPAQAVRPLTLNQRCERP